MSSAGAATGKPPARARRRPEQKVPAGREPIARVVVDVPLAHLDRPFDYLVPATLDGEVAAGTRVRVRFAGQLVDAVVLERVATTDHDGRLAYVERAVSAEPVLAPEIARLARAVADRWAGSLTDVLRLALPPRHARVEAEPAREPASPPELPPGAGWDPYPTGPAFLRALTAGRPARAVWSALPGEDWAARLAEAAAATAAGGRGAVLVVPDRTDLDRLDAALAARLGAGRHVALAADLGPA
ncbi:MAG TPA: primosome assembly protein PriA, partial [Mycobacteriales bacterium]|nr:primosome assembly protein PriA [Mycobacteriales bacterium]